MEKVQILKKTRAFDDIFKIDEALLRYRKHDGSWTPELRQLSFERGDSVAALLMRRDTGDFVLVNQFRFPTLEKGPGWLTEIVAGGLGEDETPEAAIAREVREETGYEVEKLEPIGTFYVSPGGSSERLVLFFGVVSGSAVKPEDGLGIGDEDMKLVELSPSALWEDFLAGRLEDAKTIIALLWWKTIGTHRR